LIDGEAVAGARLDDLHGECGDFKNLSPATAERLALLLSEPPFHGSYGPEGTKPESFYWKRQEEAGMKRVFGEKGMRMRAGAAGHHGFVILGDDTLVSRTIARLRETDPVPQPQLLDALAVAPDAAFLARVDISRLVAGFEAMSRAMLPQSLLDHEVSRVSPLPTVEPAVLAAWRAEQGVRIRLRLDGRLFEHILGEQERRQAQFATYRAESLRRDVLMWQALHATTLLPKPDELDAHATDDPWDVPQRIEATEVGFRIVGAGPDGEFDTEDDIVVDGEREDGD